MFATASDQWFWSDWMSDPGVRASSPSARGLWMDMLCLMAGSAEKGFLLFNAKPMSTEKLASLSHVPVDETEKLVAELEDNGVFSRDRKGRIYCRRMVRDEVKREQKQKAGKLGGTVSRDNESGIFSRSEGRSPPRRAPRRASHSHPKESKKESSLPSSRTVAAGTGTKSGLANGNGTGGKHFDADVTIADPNERINRFAASLARTVKGGWSTVATAMDDHNPKHLQALASCQAEATRLGKGWPHQWPTKVSKQNDAKDVKH